MRPSTASHPVRALELHPLIAGPRGLRHWLTRTAPSLSSLVREKDRVSRPLRLAPFSHVTLSPPAGRRSLYSTF